MSTRQKNERLEWLIVILIMVILLSFVLPMYRVSVSRTIEAYVRHTQPLAPGISNGLA